MTANVRSFSVIGAREGGRSLSAGTIGRADLMLSAGANLAADVTQVSTINQPAVDAATATLVADGATPTQAHVTTLNTAVQNLDAQLANLYTDAGAVTGFSLAGYDAAFFFDASVVLTRSKLRAILRRIDELFEGDGSLLP